MQDMEEIYNEIENLKEKYDEIYNKVNNLFFELLDYFANSDLISDDGKIDLTRYHPIPIGNLHGIRSIRGIKVEECIYGMKSIRYEPYGLIIEYDKCERDYNDLTLCERINLVNILANIVALYTSWWRFS